MKNRGQIAVETLLVYGLVILVVLLAIGALIRFGVLDLDNYLPDKCNIGSSAISCEEWKVTHPTAGTNPDSIEIALKNTFGKAIEISLITISSEDGSMNECEFVAPTGTPLPIGINQKEVVVLTSCGITSGKGEKVKGEFQITYKQANGLINQETNGILTATVS